MSVTGRSVFCACSSRQYLVRLRIYETKTNDAEVAMSIPYSGCRWTMPTSWVGRRSVLRSWGDQQPLSQLLRFSSFLLSLTHPRALYMYTLLLCLNRPCDVLQYGTYQLSFGNDFIIDHSTLSITSCCIVKRKCLIIFSFIIFKSKIRWQVAVYRFISRTSVIVKH